MMFAASMESCFLRMDESIVVGRAFCSPADIFSIFMYMYMPGSCCFQVKDLKDFPTHVLSRAWRSSPKLFNSALFSLPEPKTATGW